MEKENSIRFYCRYDAIKQRWRYCWAGQIFAFAMICFHAGKVILKDAYIPKQVFLFYGIVFLFFLVLILRMYSQSTFRLSENYFYYHGKKYDNEKYCYTFENFRLALYTVSGEDSVVPEYKKEIQVEVPEKKAEAIGHILRDCYTEKMPGTVVNEPVPKNWSVIVDFAVSVVMSIVLVAFIYRGYIVNEWEMTCVADGVEITGYNGGAAVLLIPADVDGKQVVALSNFNNTYSWKKARVFSVHIPYTVQKISGDSFKDYRSLESVSITTNLHLISESSFRGGSSFAWNIYGTDEEPEWRGLPAIASLMHIANLYNCNIAYGAFRGNTDLEIVTMNENVRSIGVGAFQGCTSLEKVVLPEGLDSISNYVFSGCEALRQINIPYGVKSVGDSAFEGCGALQSMDLPDSVEIIGKSVFSESGIREIILPGQAICNTTSTFENCNSLETVILTGSAEAIGDSVFEGCSALETVVLPEGVKVIGNSAFFGCTALKQIELPDSIETIEASAFDGSGLNRVLIPEGCTKIGMYAFADSRELEFVTLPDSLEILDTGAFHNCPIHSVFLPDNVTQFDIKTFLDTIQGNRIKLFYTENCKAADQVEDAYDNMRNSRDYYALIKVENREEYVRQFSGQYVTLSSEQVIDANGFSPAVFSIENTVWEGYYVDGQRLVPTTTAGMTVILRFHSDLTGSFDVSTDSPPGVFDRDFTWAQRNDHSVTITTEYDDIYEVYFYEDDNGLQCLRAEMEGQDNWFLPGR